MSDLSEIAPLAGEKKQKAEPRAFSPDEMITCNECLRANAPTRNTCIYCAAILQDDPEIGVAGDSAGAPSGESDNKCSVILLPGGNPDLSESEIGEAASLACLSKDYLAACLSIGQPLPLACGLTVESATRLTDRLQTLGLETLAIAEEDLNGETFPRRVRGFKFYDDVLVSVSAGKREELSFRWDELVLIVLGRLIVNRVELEQPKSRRNKKPEERRELSSDDAVLDIFTKARDDGWRVMAGSFDFSCLGEKKNALAAENIGLLAESLCERAKHAQFDESYTRLRRALSVAWPVEPQQKTQTWRHAGVGKYSVTTTTIQNNEIQFTRYSRLRHYLRLRELRNKG